MWYSYAHIGWKDSATACSSLQKRLYASNILLGVFCLAADAEKGGWNSMWCTWRSQIWDLDLKGKVLDRLPTKEYRSYQRENEAEWIHLAIQGSWENKNWDLGLKLGFQFIEYQISTQLHSNSYSVDVDDKDSIWFPEAVASFCATCCRAAKLVRTIYHSTLGDFRCVLVRKPVTRLTLKATTFQLDLYLGKFIFDRESFGFWNFEKSRKAVKRNFLFRLSRLRMGWIVFPSSNSGWGDLSQISNSTYHYIEILEYVWYTEAMDQNLWINFFYFRIFEEQKISSDYHYQLCFRREWHLMKRIGFYEQWFSMRRTRYLVLCIPFFLESELIEYLKYAVEMELMVRKNKKCFLG